MGGFTVEDHYDIVINSLAHYVKTQKKWPPVSGVLSTLHEGSYWILLLSVKKSNCFSASSSPVLSPDFLLPAYYPGTFL